MMIVRGSVDGPRATLGVDMLSDIMEQEQDPAIRNALSELAADPNAPTTLEEALVALVKARAAHVKDVATIATGFHTAASQRDPALCDEYDRVVTKINRKLAVPMPPRPIGVKVSVNMTFFTEPSMDHWVAATEAQGRLAHVLRSVQDQLNAAGLHQVSLRFQDWDADEPYSSHALVTSDMGTIEDEDD